MARGPVIYDEKPGLAQALAEAGIKFIVLDGVTTADDPEAAQAIIDAYDPLPVLKEKHIAKIKEEAQARIFEIIPAWKQANLTARAVELTAIRQDRAWTKEEQDEWNAGQAIWDRVKAIRAASDIIEKSVIEDTDWQNLDTLKISEAAEWPK
jgi:hypothetical protein